jgi:hypothetical protein
MAAENSKGFFDLVLNGITGRNIYNAETLSGALDLSTAANAGRYAQILKLDPGGAGRNVTLEAEADYPGLLRLIVNAADAAEDLTIKDDGGSTIGTVSQNEMALFACDGSSWTLVAIITIALS